MAPEFIAFLTSWEFLTTAVSQGGNFINLAATLSTQMLHQ
jgi:hypothetical protein